MLGGWGKNKTKASENYHIRNLLWKIDAHRGMHHSNTIKIDEFEDVE